MARSNGPFGPAGTRPPARRHPADDPYAPPHGQPGAQNGQWPTAPYPDLGSAGQQGQGYHFPPEPEPNNYDYGQPASPPYYANGVQQPSYPPQQQWSQQPDPRGYDLGNYMPAAPQQPYPPVDPNQFRQPDHPYAQRQGYADPDAEYDDEEFADADEPGRGRRWMFVAAAALIGAVGVGGALAYTYKSLFAPSSGRVPIVRADQGNKAKPSEKMLGRLSDDASQQAGAPGSEPDDRAGEESGGPKRVKTIPINPGAMAPASPPPGSQVSPSMPGVMVDIGPRPQAPPPKTNQPLIGQQPPPRVTLGIPPPNLPPQQVAPQDEAPPLKRTAVPPQAVTKPAPPPTARQAAPPPTTASTGAGYVAVLSSQKTRMDALKVFADLQQRYPDALSGTVPDVQEADLGEKGTWYRVVIGPPGSRDAANGVCGRLKSAGYANCWVNSY